MRILFVAGVFVFTFAMLSEAAVTFKVGPSLNTFTDSRITGLGSTFTMSFDLDKASAGYKMEQQNLTVTDAQNTANNFLLNAQISTLTMEKSVVHVTNELPVKVGLEIGSMQLTGLAGTVAAPAALSQALPLLGVNGGIEYDSVGQSVSTSIFLNFGYRFIDLRDVAVPAGFTAGGINFKDLNALHIEVGVGIGF